MRCGSITHRIGSKLCDTPRFDGTCPVETFLVHMENVVPVEWSIQAMDIVVRGTPT
jgi:hypothetical protein